MKKPVKLVILLGSLLFILQVLFTGCSTPPASTPVQATPTPTHFYSSAPATLINSGINQPYCITIDSSSGSGDLWFVGNSSPGTLYQYNSGTGANVSSTDYYTGLSTYSYPIIVVVDPSGYLYVTDYSNNQIEVLTASGTYVSTLGGLTKPEGVAINSAGTTLYVSEDTNPVLCLTFSITGAGYPKTYTPTANSFPTAAGPYEPSRGTPLALDTGGNVYARDFNGTEIIKYHPDGSSPVTFIPAGLQPWGMAFDSSGNLFVTEQMSPEYIQEYTSTGSASVSIGGFPASTNLTGITVDGSNNLYVSDTFHGYIFKITK